MKYWKAALYLENGHLFMGRGFGAKKASGGEIIFNTGMSGYQEIFTDPSYASQMVVLTYPQIGNYGVNSEDWESSKYSIQSVICREISRVTSNYRANNSLDQELKDRDIPGISEVDTREITRIVRDEGAQRAILIPTELDDESAIKAECIKHLESVAPMEGLELVSQVSCKEPYEFRPSSEENTNSSGTIVVYDFGVKTNTLRILRDKEFKVWVVPHNTSGEEVLKMQPQAVLLSNGPGDPQEVKEAVSSIEHLLGKIPIFAICMGHQLLARALGAKTYKLKFGHHGVNQPVMDHRTGRVLITSQNHGFAVRKEDIDRIEDIQLSHTNLNDQTVQGFTSDKLKLMSLQFHPEAAPGPNDAGYLFDDFIKGYLR